MNANKIFKTLLILFILQICIVSNVIAKDYPIGITVKIIKVDSYNKEILFEHNKKKITVKYILEGYWVKDGYEERFIKLNNIKFGDEYFIQFNYRKGYTRDLYDGIIKFIGKDVYPI